MSQDEAQAKTALGKRLGHRPETGDVMGAERQSQQVLEGRDIEAAQQRELAACVAVDLNLFGQALQQ